MARPEDTITYHRLSPGEVLAVFEESSRMWDDSDADLSPATTIRELEVALLAEFGTTRELGQAWNDHFGTEFTDEQWRAVLEPWDQKQLEGVCKLIASEAVVPVVEAVSVLGRDCPTAGAFRVIRAEMSDLGLDICNLWPSTPLSRYTRDQMGRLIGRLMKAKRGMLPPLQMITTWLERLCWLPLIVIVASGACAIVSMMVGKMAFVYASFAICFAGLLLGHGVNPRIIAAIGHLPTRFEDLHDFRDLSYALTGVSPATLSTRRSQRGRTRVTRSTTHARSCRE